MNQADINHLNLTSSINPTSVNFRKLQKYNQSCFKLDEIVLFELLVLLSRSFGHDWFYHSVEGITKETGIKRHRVKMIISHFREMGIIHTMLKGFPLVTHYKLDYSRIKELLAQIFNLPADFNQYDEFDHEIFKFYGVLAVDYQQKNNKKNKIKDNSFKGARVFNYDSISAIRERMNEIRKVHNLPVVNYSDGYLRLALSIYSIRDLLSYYELYCTDIGLNQMQLPEFLYFNKKNRIPYIENSKRDEKLHSKYLVDELLKVNFDFQSKIDATLPNSIEDELHYNILDAMDCYSSDKIVYAYIYFLNIESEGEGEINKPMNYFFAKAGDSFPVIERMTG